MTKKKKNINLRVIFLYVFILIISFSVIGKIVSIQYFDNEINTTSQPKYFTVKAPRGNIVADDGSLLAISMPLYDIRIDFSVIEEDVFNEGIDDLAIS